MGSQRRRRQQTPGGGGKMTAFSPPPEHVLLRRVHFMNNQNSKYVTVEALFRKQLRALCGIWCAQENAGGTDVILPVHPVTASPETVSKHE